MVDPIKLLGMLVMSTNSTVPGQSVHCAGCTKRIKRGGVIRCNEGYTGTINAACLSKAETPVGDNAEGREKAKRKAHYAARVRAAKDAEKYTSKTAQPTQPITMVIRG